MNFKKWFLEAVAAGPVPKSPLEKTYLDLLLQQYKQTTISAMAAADPTGFFSQDKMFPNLFDVLYNQLRTPKDLQQNNAQYPKEADIDQYTAAENQLVYVKDENNWHYRIPHSYNQRKVQFADPNRKDDRVSFAGLPIKQTVDALDQYVQKRVAYYKTPNQLAAWEDRHDPITMYFREPMSPQIQAELKAVLAPFSRDKYIPAKLEGDVFGPGLAQEKSPSTDDIKQLVDAAAAINPALGKTLQSKFSRGNGEIKASAGQITAAKQLIELLKKTPATGNMPGGQQNPPNAGQPQASGGASPTPGGQEPISVKKLEFDFRMKPGTLDIQMLPKSGMVSVRNRLTGKVVSVKPDRQSIEDGVAQVV